MIRPIRVRNILPWLILASLLGGCAPSAPAPGSKLTVYSGRTEALVGSLLDQFAKETGVNIQVRYGDTAQLAATILEEGNNSPADVFFAQDAGALGALEKAGRLKKLPDAALNRVDARYRSPSGQWVGVSGRARAIAYNTKTVRESDLPGTIWDLTDPKWKGKIGWSPTNGSFQAFVTALRLAEGDAKAKQWLEGLKRNDAKPYPNNIAIVDAVGRGELSLGLVNHYYLYSFLKEQGQSFPVRNYFLPGAGVGTMINVAGAGILSTARNPEAAQRFLDFLLGREAQEYFVKETFEYALISGVPPVEGMVPLESINAPKLDLGSLSDLQGTLNLLREAGVL